MVNLKGLLKDTFIYGLSSIIGRFLNYLLVPIYTMKMSAAEGEYGVITNVYAWVALLLVILTYGMETSFFRYANKQGENADKVYSTTLWSVGFTSVLFILLVLVFLQPLSNLLGYHDHPEYIGFMFTCVAIDAFQCIPFAYLRFKKKPIKFAAFKLAFIAMNITLNCIYYLGMDGHDAKTALLINLICTTSITFFFYKELQGFKHGFDSQLLKRMLNYGWPILVLGIAGVLNQTADKILFPYLYEGQDMKQQLAIYGAVVKIAMIMAMITQAFRYAYEPIVFGKDKDKDSKEYYASAMKFFIIFTLLAFLCVMAYMGILKRIIGKDYWEGLYVVPIVMAAEIMMGVYFNLSFWYKLIDKTIWGAIFSGIGCAALFAVNILFVPKNGYIACAWGGFTGYGIAMVLSYIVGQRYNPIKYPLRDIFVYVLLTAVLFIGIHFSSANLPLWASLIVNTILVGVFVAYTVKRDFPLKNLPYVGKYFK
ncbi:MAG: lipopolysaccharide biosynthesis protein [Prevotella sp.]|nr:lipopolysaccharide biosynthesis protein [Prevotella sp.]